MLYHSKRTVRTTPLGRTKHSGLRLSSIVANFGKHDSRLPDDDAHSATRSVRDDLARTKVAALPEDPAEVVGLPMTGRQRVDDILNFNDSARRIAVGGFEDRVSATEAGVPLPVRVAFTRSSTLRPSA